MARNSLNLFAERVSGAWGPLSTELVTACSQFISELLQAPTSEDWLAQLLQKGPASQELYRDPIYQFILLAHSEAEGQYRPPHDHGRSWVIYAVQSGEVEMGSYARVEEPGGQPRLVKRGSTLMRAGDVQAYLPGDIHDTLCVSGPALQFRFTERDLRHEDLEERRITRYAKQDGAWLPTAR